MIHFNLGSHDGRMLGELTSLVEAVTSSAAAETPQTHPCNPRSSHRNAVGRESVDAECATSYLPQIHLSAETAQESVRGLDASAVSQPQSSPELPRFDPAYDAGVESFQNQFGGEEE